MRIHATIRHIGEYIAKAFAFFLQTISVFKLIGLTTEFAFKFIYGLSLSITIIGTILILYKTEASLCKYPRIESFVIDTTICSNILLLFIEFAANNNMHVANIVSLIIVLILKNTQP